MNLISSRLAARSGIRQIHALHLADRAADAAERTVAGVWRDIQRVLRQPGHHYHKPRQVADLLRRLPLLVRQTYQAHFRPLARWGWQSAVEPLLEILPAQLVKAVGSVALAANRVRERSIAESFGDLLEADPGSVELSYPFRIGQPPAASRLANPPRPLSKGQAASLFQKVLFPSPSEEEINRTAFGPGFEERVSALSKLAPPDDIANTVAAGFSLGQPPQEVARDLLPVLDGVRASARRTARTLGMQVAHEAQWKAWEGLGDLKIGYQIHATRDQNTRPKHLVRDGQVYYIDPQPGQKGLDEMPRPPLESERDNSQMAPNCRCHLSVVLRPPGEMLTPPRSAVFQDVRDRVIPDPVSYQAWFDKAPEPLRRQAVGVRRYQAVAAQVEQPRYADFIDPTEGDLMPVETLASETPAERLLRVGQALELIALRKGQIESLLMFGFLNQETVLAWLRRMMAG